MKNDQKNRLKDINIKREYRSLIDKMARDFYIPLLQCAISYDRAVGFFSSTILAQISAGIAGLRNNGGKIRIVASPHLSEEDVAAIRTGYEKREEIIKNAILRELHEPKNDFEKEHLNLLANLIAEDVLDIKIAFTERESQMGMYHEKMGLISDKDGNAMAFSGSMNETSNALNLNYEAIDVFCSWKSAEELERVKNKRRAFDAIWSNTEPNITIIEFPQLKQELLDKYKRHAVDYTQPPELPVDRTPPIEIELVQNFPKIPAEVILRDYQLDAISKWKAVGYHGIFDMATGTGKTLTGLGALMQLSEDVDNKLAVIVVAPYQHLVEQWVEDIEDFNIKPIVGYSASKQHDWPKRLENAIFDQNLKVKGKDFFLFICTNATFSSDKVQSQIRKIKGDVLLIVDEAHNVGAPGLRKLLTDQFKYRLALSATIDRHYDEEGTAELFKYFGSKCVEYTLEYAIEKGNLTKYFYYPIITYLEDDEFKIYADLTSEIGKCMTYGENGKRTLNERGKLLAMKRARVVSGAKNKLSALEREILPFKNDKHLLVYCGATNVMSPYQDISDTDDGDVRQIEAVSILLGNKLNMKAARFTSKENMDTRKTLKNEFAAGDSLQALVAIKCLDEGVNIPAIKTAFILASTTNPKEYIQRRGRVLRLYKGKDYAAIYDFITLPRELDKVHYLTEEQRKMELSLVKNELKRAGEFARIALNMPEAKKVIEDVKREYSINEHLINYEEDFS